MEEMRAIRPLAALLCVLSVMATVNIAAAAPALAPTSGFDPENIFPGGGDNWEPTVAADPSSNWVYQMVTYINASKVCTDCPGTSVFFRASGDGGGTWDQARPIWKAHGKGWQFDPHVKVASDGTIYAVFLQTFDPGTVLFKSKDHGQTWTGPITMNGDLRYNDYPELEISPSGRDVYVAFNVKLDSYVAVSHDYGTSFLPPVKVNTKSAWYYTNGGVYVPPSATFPNGAVIYTAAGETGAQRTNGGHLDGPEELTVFLCTDGRCDTGASWTNAVIDISAFPPPCGEFGCYPDYFAAQNRIAVDPAGTLMMAYGLGTVEAGAKKLYIRTSTDGLRWNAPILVNDRGDSNMVNIASGPTPGDFRIAWWDNRNSACWNCGGFGGWNTWFTRTTDGGARWSKNVQLSNLGSGAPYKTPSGFDWPFGDYFGFAVNSAGTNFVIWGESDGSSIYCCGGSWFTRGT